MPSNKETLFQDHLCAFLEDTHDFHDVRKEDLPDNPEHIITKDLLTFIADTQEDKYNELYENYGEDTAQQIINALIEETEKTPLWLLIRNGIIVRGVKLELYKPYPRRGTESQFEAYEKNRFSYKKEYYYNPSTGERIDIVIWLNGLPIIVSELKHEDEGQNVEDAIHESFLKRDLTNPIYKLPFLFLALSNTEAKVATNLRSEKSFLWFNADLVNKAETDGEYPVEHVYRYALSKQSIANYLEHYLVFVPAKEKKTAAGVEIEKESFTIFPRYHQVRASKLIADIVGDHYESKRELGLKYLINHSAGSGKTLTIAWMSDLLDSLYTSDGEKVFDNIVILTDRRALDKNVRDDLEKFAHLGETKINISKKSGDLAKFLDANRDIIVTTIHKFSYIKDKLEQSEALKNRKVAFLIDEAHRSQDGKLALSMIEQFTESVSDDDTETEELERLNISNQVYVAFTATTTAKTVSFFGEPVDTYSEEMAIAEGYILDVAQSIVSYKTLYHLKTTSALPDTDFPAGIVAQALQRKAFEDDSIIQYKSEIIIKMFQEKVISSIDGKGKALVVANTRMAGLKYYDTLKSIVEEKELGVGVLYAFSDFVNEETGEVIEEHTLNGIKESEDIEDFFDTDEFRIMVVANKFQTGFDQPLLSAMFLDKPVKNTNAIQTVSRLNRKHPDKDQPDLLVVDFTNSADDIFDAFNKHRKGSPFKEEEPSKELLDEVYEDFLGYEVFTPDEVTKYVLAYLEAEEEAKKRKSTADAILSNINQDYRTQFKQVLQNSETQKEFIALLTRYCKLYFFIARFFELEDHLHDFAVFAEVMKMLLVNRGKTSELKKLIEAVELEKGALRHKKTVVNEPTEKPVVKGGLRIGSGGGGEPARSTIEEMIETIREKYPIDEKEAIVIKEICDEVSNMYSISIPIIQNRNDELYLKNRAKPKVTKEVKKGYIKREMYDKLENPMYTERGGIISLMGRSIIKKVLMREAS